jgi:two-component system sensor histidine kinase UhpB
MSDRIREIADQVARITAENTRLLTHLSDSEKRFRRISHGVLRLQEAERGRISRDLHDGIGQSLTALKIQLELLEQEAARQGSPLMDRIASARQLAAGCLDEVRQLSHLLRPQMLDELGLLPTLRWLVRTVRERTGLAVTLDSQGCEDRMEPDVETLVYRIAQESLTNVVKHAGVLAARVHLTRQDDRLLLRVEDSGAGFDAEGVLSARDEERGFGVRAMRDRVHFFNGRFALRSEPGSGTVVEAELPLASGEAG